MKVRRTPRELTKEVDGAVFVFRRADLREIGTYYTARPPELAELWEEVSEARKEGRDLSPEDLGQKAVEIHNKHPEWYQYRIDFVLDKLIRVSGITYEDGTPVDLTSVVWDVPPNVITQLINWYEIEMVNALPNQVTEEKKTDEGENPPVAQEHSIPADS